MLLLNLIIRCSFALIGEAKITRGGNDKMDYFDEGIMCFGVFN